MNKTELDEILKKHQAWLEGQEGGECADLTGADLTRANLTDADLTGADLTRADLTRADLTRANLTRANLTWANLAWADLTDATLSGAKDIIMGPQRSDGYVFMAVKHKTWMIYAGCRYFSFKEYREHVKTYDSPQKRRETLHILDYLEVIAKEADPNSFA